MFINNLIKYKPTSEQNATNIRYTYNFRLLSLFKVCICVAILSPIGILILKIFLKISSGNLCMGNIAYEYHI